MTKLSKKLDSRTQIQLAIGELPDDLELMLRLDEDISKEQKEALVQAGCTLQTDKGKVIVGRSKRSALEKIAEHDFIQHIEVSRTLHEEPESEDEM